MNWGKQTIIICPCYSVFCPFIIKDKLHSKINIKKIRVI
jgi:hypothetical protein